MDQPQPNNLNAAVALSERVFEVNSLYLTKFRHTEQLLEDFSKFVHSKDYKKAVNVSQKIEYLLTQIKQIYETMGTV